MAKKRERERPPQHAQPFFTEETHIISKKKKLRPSKQHKHDKVSSAVTSKILKQALIQQKEIQDDEAIHQENQENPFSLVADHPIEASDDSDDEDQVDFGGIQDRCNGGYQGVVNEEEERILDAFMWGDANVVVDKIREKVEQVSSDVRPPRELVDIYKEYSSHLLQAGKLLNKYTGGKFPKAFKHIPSWELFESALYLAEPEKWSANALFQATRIFASQLKPEKAQRFYSLVLLPRIREDIRKNKVLNFDIYRALKKSLYKPAAFFKGILFPLCESGTCNIREAVIVGSVIQKVSIPPEHSGAAIMELANMQFCGITSYFIKLLLDKKYALSHRVLDAVVAHFMRFLEDARVMPVIWHQSLLTFVQRYKNDLTKEDKENLQNLIQFQKHYLVTNEIHRELKSSRNRGEKDDPMSIVSPATAINKAIEEDRFDLPEVPMED